MNKKVKESIDLIKKSEKLAIALSPDDGIIVAFSGGKDSMVVLDLVKRARVKYRAEYYVTTIDPPESVRFIRDNYHEVNFIHPKKTFLKMVEEKGLPTMLRRYCCERLKEGQASQHVVITGVRAEESKKRSRYEEVSIHSNRKEHADKHRVTIEGMINAQHKCVKGKDKVMVYPILKWTEEDVLNYIEKRGLKKNPCYEYTKRVGCMFCPFAGRKEIEMWEEKYPKWKENILKAMEKYKARCKEKKGKEPSWSVEEYYKAWKEHKSIQC